MTQKPSGPARFHKAERPPTPVRLGLTVQGLTVGTRRRTLVKETSFTIAPGEKMALIGESGSGKTLTASAIMGLLPENLTATGTVTINGSPNLLTLKEADLARWRGSEMAMVFQEPLTALDPLMRVGNQLTECFQLGDKGSSGSRFGVKVVNSGTPGRVATALEQVGLPASVARAYPHQLSGGQRQRVMLAMAMANNPTLLIADEPTTALDRLVQSQVLQLLSSLVEKTGTGLLFISHDLAVVQQVAQRVMVMKDGVVVESGETAQVLSSPSHPYTQQLLRASNLNPSWQGIGGGARATSSDPVIVVRDLVKDYRRPASLGRKPDPVQALRQVSLTVYPGEQLGIVGESGSGKSTLVKILAGLETPTTGSVKVTGQRQLVFQDPYSSLDPRWKVGRSLAEPLQTPSKSQQAELVAQTLTQVGLEPELVAAYPHQLSGGQRQRVAIGRALIAKPQILLADEPVSALDVTTKAEILELLAMCASEQGLTLVMVSHDLHAVRFLCERLVVMKDGVIVEQGPTAQIWDNPQHPYTQSLKGNYEIDTAQR